MIGLREEVEGRDVLQSVAAFDKSCRVACEGRWVAGNVGDDLRVDLEDRVDSEFIDASAGRVNDHVNGFGQLRGEGGQYFFGSTFIEFDVVEFVEVDGKVFTGRWGRFDADDFGVFAGKEFAE